MAWAAAVCAGTARNILATTTLGAGGAALSYDVGGATRLFLRLQAVLPSSLDASRTVALTSIASGGTDRTAG